MVATVVSALRIDISWVDNANSVKAVPHGIVPDNLKSAVVTNLRKFHHAPKKAITDQYGTNQKKVDAAITCRINNLFSYSSWHYHCYMVMERILK